MPNLESRAPLARRRTSIESGARPVPASTIRPERSRTIAVMRRSRPERDTRTMPLLPNVVSREPSAFRRITEPRAVPAAVVSVPATSVVVVGPWRTAAAPSPGPVPGLRTCVTTPVPPQVGSSAPAAFSLTTVNEAAPVWTV